MEALQLFHHHLQQKKRYILPLASCLLLSTLLIFSSHHTLFSSSSSSSTTPSNPDDPLHLFVESKLRPSPPSPKPLPRLAYLVSGSIGDGDALKRTLKALYHPLNFYAVHLDLESPAAERLELARFVREEPVFVRFGNVRVVTRANLVTYRGPTMVANTLHAAAILLKEWGEWDWFINLSASDYPLVTQDDLLHTLSSIPRQLNFIEHTSDIGWKEYHRAKPVIIDPGLYSLQKVDVFWITEKRSLPTAFKLFTGSAWMMLSRSFMEYCLWGWDNLPRTVLMYYANFLSSPEGYFHTVICNTDDFINTTVNHDLHFISWDNPPKQHPHFLTVLDYAKMVASNAPFARKFNREEPVLDRIDSELLGRRSNSGYVPGGWYDGRTANSSDPLSGMTNVTELRPGPGAEKLRSLITGLLSKDNFDGKHCI
ncbi:hypothetical protein QJS10_CPA10g00342 [Acorus calamus]|uniref:Uncharacterized protein n=1 Tax=Acorus calamus TaxID=4465 RepID=A0AAV9E1C1_ACOCL|nr:hypothetical protein QJS10_CPA10g00342 [Acorus calamus]